MEKRRDKISFVAARKVSKPVKVEFYTKGGDKVVFKAKQTVTKPTRVEFYAKKKK